MPDNKLSGDDEEWTTLYLRGLHSYGVVEIEINQHYLFYHVSQFHYEILSWKKHR